MVGKRYYILRILFCLTAAALIIGCKSANRVIASGVASDKLSAKQVIKQHQKSESNFSTLQAKVRIDVIEGDKAQGLTLNLRMEKDKTIWLSAPLGLARMVITPDKVRFYSKQDNEYFDGNYQLLSDVVGVELDFLKVQNILLGQAIYDLKDQPHEVMVNGNSYVLQPKTQNILFELFYLINPSHFKMDSLQVFQQLKKRILQVDYATYQSVDRQVLPQRIDIIAVEDRDEIKIALEFKSVSINQELRFPFRIPSGYKEIQLK